MSPRPVDGCPHKLSPRAGDEVASQSHGKEVCERMEVEGESQVDDWSPGVGETRGVEKEGSDGEGGGQETD